MRHLNIPSLFEHTQASSFFAAFIALNSHRRSFSQRSFSTKLGWPISYIPDLIKERKKFSVRRAIQFGNYVKLDPIDFEKLVNLAIVSTYQDEESLNGVISPRKNNFAYDTNNEEVNSAKVMLVFSGIQWLQEFATEKKVISLAKERNIEAQETKMILKYLVDKKLIEKNGLVYRNLQKTLAVNYDGIEKDDYTIWQEFVEFQRIFYEKIPPSPSCFSSSLVILDNSRFDEINAKMAAFLNWIVEVADVDQQLGSAADTSIYQFDINLAKLTSNANCKKLRSP
jgi:Domain of unknown function (DUF4423)